MKKITSPIAKLANNHKVLTSILALIICLMLITQVERGISAYKFNKEHPLAGNVYKAVEYSTDGTKENDGYYVFGTGDDKDKVIHVSSKSLVEMSKTVSSYDHLPNDKDIRLSTYKVKDNKLYLNGKRAFTKHDKQFKNEFFYDGELDSTYVLTPVKIN